jgi:hypothetical protein
MAGKTGPAMFADLTHDETWILSLKLMSGAAAAAHGTGNYDVSGEIHDVSADVQATWKTDGGQ